MGIRQLGRLEEHLKKNHRWFTRRAVMRELGMNYNTVSASFSYFLQQKKVKRKTTKDGIIMYTWKRKKRRRSA